MNNAQKLVFTELLAMVVLKFGISTKIGRLWNLAFTATAGQQGIGKP